MAQGSASPVPYPPAKPGEDGRRAAEDLAGGRQPEADPRLSPRFRRLIEAACDRLDLAWPDAGTRITLDLDLDALLRVEREETIILGAGALDSPAMTLLCLRHGMELLLLGGMTPRPAPAGRDLAAGLLALRTAGFTLQALAPDDREACRGRLPRWQREAFDLLTVPRPAALPKDMLASIASPTLEIQGRTLAVARPGAKDPVDWAQVADILERAGGLAMPTAHPAAEALRRELLSAALLGDLETACASAWQRLGGEPREQAEPADLLALAAGRDGSYGRPVSTTGFAGARRP